MSGPEHRGRSAICQDMTGNVRLKETPHFLHPTFYSLPAPLIPYTPPHFLRPADMKRHRTIYLRKCQVKQDPLSLRTSFYPSLLL